MSVTVGPYEFDDVEYDAEYDILYLSIGVPQEAIGEDTPEGHTFSYANGRVVGLDIFGPRRLLAREGRINVTLPDGQQIDATGIESAVGVPA